mmetsp:Transcript_82541/g.181420  ORF Transcript_82541/g.181420 Transcript_82541/m.181420 type:complete len:299 (+) Transcript_82541:56-952(+)
MELLPMDEAEGSEPLRSNSSPFEDASPTKRSFGGFPFRLAAPILSAVIIYASVFYMSEHSSQTAERTSRDALATGSAIQAVGIAGPSILCWLVTRSYGNELALVKAHYKNHRSIFACDDHIVFSDKEDLSPIKAENIGPMESKRAPWGGWYNTEVFLTAWDRLARSGHFAAHSWIVKVDADSVFFPDRLPAHLMGLNPAAPLYVKDGQTMLGAIEVYSNAAVQVFADQRVAVCNKDIQVSGEDGFINKCMETLGVKASVDNSLLKSTTNIPDCADHQYVVFHPFVDEASVDECYKLGK